MTRERHTAYTAALGRLSALRQSKFHPAEYEQLTTACEDLLLTDDAGEHRTAIASAQAVLDALRDAGRLLPETAAELMGAITDVATGPRHAVAA